MVSAFKYADNIFVCYMFNVNYIKLDYKINELR